MVRYSDEHLLSELRRIFNVLGRTPTCDEIKRFSAPNKTTYTNRFGSYTVACELAGIPPIRARKNSTDTELLDYLKEVYSKLQRPLSSHDFRINSKYHIDTISKRFGGFCAACRKAGVPTVSHYGVTDDEMLSDLKTLYEQLGRAPATFELARHGLASDVMYRERFGTYSNALFLVGVRDFGHSAGAFGGVRCFAKDGTLCNSLAELTITEYLIDAVIPFKKEVHYPGTNYRTDWVVEGTFIEYFGLVGQEQYDQKIKIKRELCAANGINLIEIYPKDINRIDEILGIFRPHAMSLN